MTASQLVSFNRVTSRFTAIFVFVFFVFLDVKLKIPDGGRVKLRCSRLSRGRWVKRLRGPPDSSWKEGVGGRKGVGFCNPKPDPKSQENRLMDSYKQAKKAGQKKKSMEVTLFVHYFKSLVI